MDLSSKPTHGMVRWLGAALCIGLVGCGGSGSEESDRQHPPKAERPQSPNERRVGALAWEFQKAFSEGDYDTVCEMLSSAMRQELDVSAGSCSAGVEATRKASPIPKIAWVRLRGGWGTVVIREHGSGLALAQVIREDGHWRFPSLTVTGANAP